MSPRALSIASAALLALPLSSCHRAPHPIPPLAVEEREPDPLDLAPEPDEILDADVDDRVALAAQDDDVGVPSGPLRFVAEGGESAGLYARWMEMPSREVVKLLSLKRASSLRAGREYTLDVPATAQSAFLAGRKKRADDRRSSWFADRHVVEYERHVVARGESARRISRKAEIPLWLLAEANPGVNMRPLVVGDILDVPSIGDGPEPRPERLPTLGAPDRAAATAKAADLEPLDVKPPPTTLAIRVKKGESLSMLARLAGVDADQLARDNGLTDPDRIAAGTRLRVDIPPERWADFLAARQRLEQLRKAVSSYRRRGYVVRLARVRPGDTASTLARALGADPASLEVLNPGVDLDVLRVGATLRMAVPGDNDARHHPEGTP